MARNTFPDDLIQLQDIWTRTYENLAGQPRGASTTAARRHLIQLSGLLMTHAYWSEPGCPTAAWDMQKSTIHLPHARDHQWPSPQRLKTA